MGDLNVNSRVDLWILGESVLGRKGWRASDVRKKQLRKMAGETEHFGIVEFCIRIMDKREQNRLTKKPHIGAHMPVALISLHLKKAFIGSE